MFSFKLRYRQKRRFLLWSCCGLPRCLFVRGRRRYCNNPKGSTTLTEPACNRMSSVMRTSTRTLHNLNGASNSTPRSRWHFIPRTELIKTAGHPEKTAFCAILSLLTFSAFYSHLSALVALLIQYCFSFNIASRKRQYHAQKITLA